MARLAIAIEVHHGGEVANPAFAARHGLPTYGAVCMHVLGFPKRWVRPPYEEQASRLFARFDSIRGRVPQDDSAWFDAQAKALAAFRRTGELPDDDLHADAVLANVELDLLISHKHGRDVAEAMKVFDAFGWSGGAKKDAALDQISELAKAGRLR